MRILIVEDNREIATNLYDYLETEGHLVDVEYDGIKALQSAKKNTFDVILLDLGLPRMDGIVLCRKIRNELHLDTPILMLTARDTLKDKLAGFQHGADDYLVKPFDLEEVSARLNVLHKRSKGKGTARTIQVGELAFDPKTMSVTFHGVHIPLPPICTRLMEVFISEPTRLFSRKELEIELWGDEQNTSDRLRNHMHVLRNAFSEAGHPNPVKNIHGMGYRLAIRNDTDET